MTKTFGIYTTGSLCRRVFNFLLASAISVIAFFVLFDNDSSSCASINWDHFFFVFMVCVAWLFFLGNKTLWKVRVSDDSITQYNVFLPFVSRSVHRGDIDGYGYWSADEEGRFGLFMGNCQKMEIILRGLDSDQELLDMLLERMDEWDVKGSRHEVQREVPFALSLRKKFENKMLLFLIISIIYPYAGENRSTLMPKNYGNAILYLMIGSLGFLFNKEMLLMWLFLLLFGGLFVVYMYIYLTERIWVLYGDTLVGRYLFLGFHRGQTAIPVSELQGRREIGDYFVLRENKKLWMIFKEEFNDYPELLEIVKANPAPKEDDE